MTNKCAQCNKLFVNGDQKSKYKDLEYHQACFKCSTCEKPIQFAFFNLGDGTYRCSDCQQELEVIITCAQCSKPIDDGSYIQYKDRSMHPDCFQCETCSQSLANMLYVEHDNKPHCVTCHMENYAQSCAICNRPFAPGTSTRKCQDSYFHIECFRCFNCGKVILTKNYLINRNQQRLCEICA
jgi:hypothetical protein